MTGDWVVEVDCDRIKNGPAHLQDRVVYFGPSEDLLEEGEAYSLVKTSMLDRYNFEDHRVVFYSNNDPECKKHYFEDTEKRYIALLTGNEKPIALVVGEDAISGHHILYMINT